VVFLNIQIGGGVSVSFFPFLLSSLAGSEADAAAGSDLFCAFLCCHFSFSVITLFF
jgi:hypothetical protein